MAWEQADDYDWTYGYREGEIIQNPERSILEDLWGVSGLMYLNRIFGDIECGVNFFNFYSVLQNICC